MNIKSLLLRFAKEHKFLFASIILSFLICIPIFVFLLIVIPIWEITIFLVPIILILLISLIANYTYTKFPILTKFITAALNTIIIIVSAIFVLFVISFIQNPFPHPEHKIYENPIQYQEAKNSIDAQYRVYHFPKAIPENAKNIRLYKTNNSWFGSEEMILEFDIDKQYIENELKTYKFISIDKDIRETPNEYNFKYNEYRHIIGYGSNLNVNDFIFYVINNRDNENPKEHSFPYHYGIAVNKKHNKIIYYYDCPD